MRISLALVLASTLAGCSSGAMQHLVGDDDVGSGDDTPIDGAMPDAGFDPPTQGFGIRSPMIDLPPGSDLTYCYYFHTSNAADVAIKKWDARLSDGTLHAVVYLTPTDLKTPGALTTNDCDFNVTGPGPRWAYGANLSGDAIEMPADDGTGVPVGQPIPANQPGFLLMHLVNPGDKPIQVHVEVNAYAYAAGTQVTPAGPFITYSSKIALAPGSATLPSTGMASDMCPMSPSLKFFAMTTQTNKQGKGTLVADGSPAGDDSNTVFKSADWKSPGTKHWPAPFYSFASGNIYYQCSYSNANNYSIVNGDNTAKDEVCKAIGYFFPSPGGAGLFCLNHSMQN